MGKVSDDVKALEAERDRLQEEVRRLKSPPPYTAYYIGGPYDLTKRPISRPETDFVCLLDGYARHRQPWSYSDYMAPATGRYRLQGHLSDNVLIYEWVG